MATTTRAAAAPLGAPAATLGIRPEHLTLGGKGRITGTIAHVERLGGDTNLLVTTAQGETLTVRLFGQHPHQVDDPVSLDFEDRNAYAFDIEGRRIKI